MLPGADPTPLAALVRLEVGIGAAPRWQRRLAALGWRTEWTDALRLSRADSRTLAAIATAAAGDEPPAAIGYRHGAEVARDATLIRAARSGRPLPDGLEAEVARGAAAAFPLASADLGLEGPALGQALARLEAAWIASDFALGAAELKALADR